MLWLTIIGGLLLVVAFIAYAYAHRARLADLGAVSERWIQEHRVDAP
jgi:hypothetical protein